MQAVITDIRKYEEKKMADKMYERYEEARKAKGLTDSDVSAQSGVSRSTFSDWKHGRHIPSAEKIRRMAECIDVPVEYIITGERPTYGQYFLDPEVAQMAQELHDNHDLYIVFDAIRKASKDDIQFVVELVKRMGLDE